MMVVYKYEILLRNQENKERNRSAGLSNMEQAVNLDKSIFSGMVKMDVQMMCVK